jgi:outer membrane protein insertion porin family
LFVNNLELRFPETSLPFLGEGFGFAVFHDMGNVYTAPHDMITGALRWHQPNTQPCLASGSPTSEACTVFSNYGYDYTSHAVGVGLRYKTPIGPLRFDFGYNLNPTRYFEVYEYSIPNTSPVQTVPIFATQRLRNLNVFFSIGQPF